MQRFRAAQSNSLVIAAEAAAKSTPSRRLPFAAHVEASQSICNSEIPYHDQNLDDGRQNPARSFTFLAHKSDYNMPTTTAETLTLVTRNVSVAPLVLLSVVDHYNRAAAKSTKNKRVVGVLLGQNDGKNVRVSNSFAGT
jgi:hypothetical protein